MTLQKVDPSNKALQAEITQAVTNGLKEGKGITKRTGVDFTDKMSRILRFQMMIEVKKGVCLIHLEVKIN